MRCKKKNQRRDGKRTEHRREAASNSVIDFCVTPVGTNRSNHDAGRSDVDLVALANLDCLADPSSIEKCTVTAFEILDVNDPFVACEAGMTATDLGIAQHDIRRSIATDFEWRKPLEIARATALDDYKAKPHRRYPADFRRGAKPRPRREQRDKRESRRNLERSQAHLARKVHGGRK